MKEIKLTQGKVALIDDDDYALISGHKWYAMYSSSKIWYAVSFVDGKGTRMHSLILPGYKQIDHINHDGLDNRRANLRPCNDSKNQGNQRLHKHIKTSKFKGVWKDKYGWRSAVTISRKQIHLGTFENETDAAKAYDAAAKKVFGEFSYTNHDLGLL